MVWTRMAYRKMFHKESSHRKTVRKKTQQATATHVDRHSEQSFIRIDSTYTISLASDRNQ